MLTVEVAASYLKTNSLLDQEGLKHVIDMENNIILLQLKISA